MACDEHADPGQPQTGFGHATMARSRRSQFTHEAPAPTCIGLPIIREADQGRPSALVVRGSSADADLRHSKRTRQRRSERLTDWPLSCGARRGAFSVAHAAGGAKRSRPFGGHVVLGADTPRLLERLVSARVGRNPRLLTQGDRCRPGNCVNESDRIAHVTLRDAFVSTHRGHDAGRVCFTTRVIMGHRDRES